MYILALLGNSVILFKEIMKNINSVFMVNLIKNLLYISIDQPISLSTIRIILVMTRSYKKML